MAMAIFLVLNGLGVIFLLYVLVNFWKEGHRSTPDDRNYAAKFVGRDGRDADVLTTPISHTAPGGLSVIPFRVRDRYGDRLARGTTTCETSDVPLKRISTRYAKNVPGQRDMMLRRF
jgi:hypothetical protein